MKGSWLSATLMVVNQIALAAVWYWIGRRHERRKHEDEVAARLKRIAALEADMIAEVVQMQKTIAELRSNPIKWAFERTMKGKPN